MKKIELTQEKSGIRLGTGRVIVSQKGTGQHLQSNKELAQELRNKGYIQ